MRTHTKYNIYTRTHSHIHTRTHACMHAQVEHRHFEAKDWVEAALPFLPTLKEGDVKPVLEKMAQKVCVCVCQCQ